MSERDVIFRATFLARFPKAEDREVLQRFGSLVLSWAVAAEHSEEGRSTLTASALAAAAADLRHLSSYLRAVVDEVEGCVVGDAEARLGKRARTWTGKAADLAREIEAAVEEAEAEGRAEEESPAPAPDGRTADESPAPAPARADLHRLADRLAWIRSAHHDAKGAEAALRAISEDGPDPDLHRHLIIRASDLGHELELLLEEEGAERKDPP